MPKHDPKVIPTFVIPENILGISVSAVLCQATAWRIETEIQEVYEVKLETIGRKHVIIVSIAVPEGVSSKSPILGALTHKVDQAAEAICRDVCRKAFGKATRQTTKSHA